MSYREQFGKNFNDKEAMKTGLIHKVDNTLKSENKLFRDAKSKQEFMDALDSEITSTVNLDKVFQ